jgi:hypothetical protein
LLTPPSATIFSNLGTYTLSGQPHLVVELQNLVIPFDIDVIVNAVTQAIPITAGGGDIVLNCGDQASPMMARRVERSAN